MIRFFLIAFFLPSLTWASDSKDLLLDTNAYSIEKKTLNWHGLQLKDQSQIKMALESPSQKSTLTLREFKNSPHKSLKQHVLSWLQDYSTYGLSISDKRPLKLNDQTYGYKVEALHKESGKLFVQFMSVNKEKMVTLTCQSDRVDEELKSCFEAVSSFSWKKDF